MPTETIKSIMILYHLDEIEAKKLWKKLKREFAREERKYWMDWYNDDPEYFKNMHAILQWLKIEKPVKYENRIAVTKYPAKLD